MKRIIGVIIVLSCGLLSSCYTLKNQSIPKDLKTLNIQFFENNAPLVVNNLSQTFTEALKERVRTQSPLSLVRGEGRCNFVWQHYRLYYCTGFYRSNIKYKPRLLQMPID
jgi:hypothetical protein